jgi:NTP pyrophosphatase (non-canonical NTP hydrolase)
MTGFRQAQDRAWANKVDKRFSVTDVPLEFCLLHREISEAFTAWREGSAELGAELADVAIFTMGLAEMTGVDLRREVEAKLSVNQGRPYIRLPNGTPVKQARTRSEPAPEA